MTGTTERFAALFAGRTDAYGTEEGGCLRINGPAGPELARVAASGGNPAQKQTVWSEHLDGTRPIGVYPLVPYNISGSMTDEHATDSRLLGWTVKWGCIDLDVKGPTHATGYETHEEALEAAQNLVTALRALSLTGWIERTRSGGFHVWVFAAEWVPASVMRRALLVACAVVEVPPTEVNPKSEGFDSPETLGNYVRLPYPAGLLDPNDPVRQRFKLGGLWGRAIVDMTMRVPVPKSLVAFLDYAEESLASTPTLEAAAALHVPPIQHERTIDLEREVILDDALRHRLGGLAHTMLENGTLDGQDRSSYLFKLASQCREDDLNAEEALAVVRAADEAHTRKYVDRPDADLRLSQTVERAWR